MSLANAVEPTTPDTGETPPAEGTTPESAPSELTPREPTGAEWYYDEHLKGDGDRPDWLKPKYKSAADQAKAYTDLEKKLGAFTGAPESYNLELKNYPDVKFADNDPLLKDFLDGAKKNGISQEYVSELLETYAGALTHNMVDTDAEMAKLGPDAHNEINSLVNWGSNQFTPDEMDIFKGLMTTAESVRLLEKVRNLATSSDIAPPVGGGSMTPHESVESVTDLVGDPRYQTDEGFRREVKQRSTVAMSRAKK